MNAVLGAMFISCVCGIATAAADDVYPQQTEELAAYIKSEIVKWAKIIKATGVTAE